MMDERLGWRGYGTVLSPQYNGRSRVTAGGSTQIWPTALLPACPGRPVIPETSQDCPDPLSASIKFSMSCGAPMIGLAASDRDCPVPDRS